MKNALSIAIAALLLVPSFAPAAAQTPKPIDLTGSWIGKTEVPDVGILELYLTVKKDKDSYTGTIVDSMGLIMPDTAFKIVELKADSMVMTFPLGDGALITCRFKFDAERISGPWEHPEGSTGMIEMSRKK